MKDNKKCGCSVFAHYHTCNEETEVTSETTAVIEDTDKILLTDRILVIRKNVDSDQKEVYQASWDDLSAEIALLLLQKSVHIMPRVDPADGQSLWLDEGFLRIASGDPSQLGALSPTALEKSLKEAFKILPTSDPGDGSPWLCGGVLMQGSSNKTNNCC